MKKFILLSVIVCCFFAVWFLVSEIYFSQAQKIDKVNFEVKEGESVYDLSTRLEKEGVIRNAWFFRKYLSFTGRDKSINVGSFELEKPITMNRVVGALAKAGINEREITIIPGWDLRDIADYFEKQGIASKDEFYIVTGKPAQQNQKINNINLSSDFLTIPKNLSLEGYFAPNTYRIYKNSSIKDIIMKLLLARSIELKKYQIGIEKSGHTLHEILTMASILEKEVRGQEDRKKVADILWRRYEKNWALQVDSSVHYAVGKEGEVFTTQEDRNSLSPWNTYKYPGLPVGPICNPSIISVEAAINPTSNNYWYFLTDKEGVVHYAKTLEEHNRNKKYL